MRKRKRKERGKRRAPPKKKAKGGPFYFKHPLTELPREKLIPALVEHAKASRARFQEHLGTILQTLRSAEPLQTITTLAVFGLFGGLNDQGKHTQFLKKSRFGQAHVELVQALILTIPQADLAWVPPHPSVIQQLFDLLPQLGESFVHQRMVVMEQERSDQQKSLTLIQELLRMHTQNVRNWGYFDKVVRIVNELYEPLDNAFVEHLGLAATKIAAAFLYLIRSSEEKVNANLEILRQVFLAKSVAGMIRKYYELNPDFTDSAQDLLELANRQKLSTNQTKALILGHVDYRLQEVFRFSSASMAAVLGVAEANITNVFKMLSLKFGDLSSHQTERLLLDNPVWQKPVIDVGQNNFFCAIPQLFFSFVRPLLDELVAGNSTLQHACEDRRAEFLESELAQLFRRAFPQAEIVAGFKWRDGDTEYENDLLVRVDSYLLLVEAKSGTVSWPALRGAPDRAKRHIEDLLIAPSIQSARLAERIKEVISLPELGNSYLPNLSLRLDQVHTVLRLSVTLEDFAMTQANLHPLEGTGWLPANHKLAPCMLLTDLEIIFDILEPAGQKLHYLRRRTELAAHMVTMGDELDHLGYYLMNGFNIGETEFDHVNLQLVGMSKEVDDFCMARAEGFQTKKPRLRLGKWWSEICATIESRAFNRWTETCNILLSLSPDEQIKAEGMFQKLKKKLRTNRNNPKLEDFVMVIPNPHKSDALALYAFHDENKSRRHERMQSIASQTFDHAHVAKCLVVAVNIDKEHSPYSTLGVFSRNDVPEGANVDDLVVY
jgi:hypothetical protein